MQRKYIPIFLSLLALGLLSPAARAQTSTSRQGMVTDVSDFTSNGTADSDPNGDAAFPEAALVFDAANGLYYGTAAQGGANGNGDVFSFNPATGVVTDVGDFVMNSTQLTNNGESPVASLTLDPANGKFYGTAELGGNGSGSGDVFEFDPTDSNPATSITDVGDFTSSATVGTSGGNGARPNSALVYDSANGKFYGAAPQGGADSDGDVYEFDPTNSLYYGTTFAGGPDSDGNIYSFDPATGDFADAADFTSNLAGSSGAFPDAPLVYDAVNGLFYGTTQSGGAFGEGDVFSFSPSASTGTGGGTTTPTVLTTLAAGLQLVCLDETYKDFAAALQTTAPPPFVTWNGSAYALSDSATEAAPAPGTAFWVAPPGPLPIFSTGTAATGTVSLSLTQGWNLIGDPFSDPSGFSLADIIVNGVTGLGNANAQSLLYGTLYSWGTSNTTGYTPMDGLASGANLTPFTGYWLYAFHPCTLTLSTTAASNIRKGIM